MNLRRAARTAGALGACVLVGLFAVRLLHDRQPVQAAEPPRPSAQQERATAPLFPGVDDAASFSMSILSADRVFEFTQTGSASSVNGHRADSEILRTLITQVAQMPISPREAFSPKDAPMMTITVVSGSSEHTARFYKSLREDEADVLYTHQAQKYYGVTDAWRMGTVLLACDGTRILDEGGNEYPLQQ